MLFVGRDVQTIKGKRDRHFFDKYHKVALHALHINIDEILSFGKKIAGIASMFLPFKLVSHNGQYRRVRADDDTAVILPNIPTTTITGENGGITGCVAVGTSAPLPILVGFIDSNDKMALCTRKTSWFTNRSRHKLLYFTN